MICARAGVLLVVLGSLLAGGRAGDVEGRAGDDYGIDTHQPDLQAFKRKLEAQAAKAAAPPLGVPGSTGRKSTAAGVVVSGEQQHR